MSSQPDAELVEFVYERVLEGMRESTSPFGTQSGWEPSPAWDPEHAAFQETVRAEISRSLAQRPSKPRERACRPNVGAPPSPYSAAADMPETFSLT